MEGDSQPPQPPQKPGSVQPPQQPNQIRPPAPPRPSSAQPPAFEPPLTPPLAGPPQSGSGPLEPPSGRSYAAADPEAAYEAHSEPSFADDPGSTGNQVDYKSYNQEQAISSRPCENCGGQLQFNIEHQQLGCQSCGHLQDIVHSEGAAVVEQDFDAMMDGARSRENERLQHNQGEKEVVCQNCGGHTTFVGTLTTTKCPYCATDIARTDVHEAPDRLIVDGVLPFAITEEDAEAKLKAWVNKRWFAPGEYKKYSTTGSFQSIYAAYFTYDARVATQYDGARGTTHTRTVGQGKETRTETYTVWHDVHGLVRDQFDDITILANTGFQQSHVHKLEPWPTFALQPYNPDYVSGHLCRTYDIDAKECFGPAHQQIKAGVEQSVRRDIGGDHQQIRRMNMRMSDLTYKHVLLPIWLLTVLYNGQAMQVFMNGSTGEIHGQRPWSRVKIGAAVIGVILLIVLILIAKSAAG